MAPIDCIVLALIVIACIAVCARVRRKGVCADCAQSGSCAAHCAAGAHGSCPAHKGVDTVADELGRHVR